MRASLLFLVIPLLAAAISPGTAQVPATPSAMARPDADKLELLIWQGALRADTAAAYHTYLDRYPNGAFADLARTALARIAGGAAAPTAPAADVATGVAAAVTPVAPAPAAAVPPPAAAAPPPLPFLCRPVFAGGVAPFEQAGEAEIAAYLVALRADSIAAYRQYLAAWPRGVFAPEVGDLVASREGRTSALAAAPQPGPAPAKAREPVAIAAQDYPSIALRDSQEGATTAAWDVSEDGCVEQCRVTQSSGSPALDAAACRAVTARGRYDPARDAAGKPVRAVDGGSFAWHLPQH